MKDKDQLAFPMTMDVHSNVNEYHTGLTKREYAAIMMAQGIRAMGLRKETGSGPVKISYILTSTELAKQAISDADALLSALSPSSSKDKIE